MHDAVEVGVVQGAGQAGDDAQHLGPGQRHALRDELGQRAALQVLQGDEERAGRVVAPHVVDDHDAGVRELGRHPRLGQEALLERLPLLRRHGEGQVDGLEGDEPLQGGVLGQVDYAHGAAAQRPQHGVTSNPR